jgi:hypothetical protein
MLDTDVTQLSEPYPPTMPIDTPPHLRLAGPLGLDLRKSVQLGDEILGDLDVTTYGIGWWRAYSDLDSQTRILLSDYLLTCARAIPDNLIEARVELLELDHAIEDYRNWMNRGGDANGQYTIAAAESPYEELSNRRVRTHLAGALRAWGSALDCVGGCIVGVTGVPAHLVKADMYTAQEALHKHSPGDQLLEQLQTSLEKVEMDAGPTGWRDWLLGMRNTVVHRGRRTVTWSGNFGAKEVLDFDLLLPIAPDRTEIDAIILSGGVIAATFKASAAEILNELSKTVGTYVNEACGLLENLWSTRRANPGLLAQSPKQWKQPPGLITLPSFRGFPHMTPQGGMITSYAVSPEEHRRIRAAALRTDGDDIKPDPGIWS